MTRLDGNGRLGYPNDPANMNNYAIDNEANIVKGYQVIVDVTGDNGDEYNAKVQTYINEIWVGLTTVGNGAPVTLQLGDSLTLQGGTLPKTLTVERVSGSGCNTVLEFTYGTISEATEDWFNFHSDTVDGEGQSYCTPSDVLDSDGDYLGQRFTCDFPGY